MQALAFRNSEPIRGHAGDDLQATLVHVHDDSDSVTGGSGVQSCAQG